MKEVYIVSMASIPQKVQVCIVGAGVAGLGAAQRLVQSGVTDIIVLEAQDRVGGRVYTVNHGDEHIEIGAHWIHGEEDNVVYQWALENGLVNEDFSLVQTGLGNRTFLRENGEEVPKDIVEGCFDAIEEIRDESNEDFINYPHSQGQYYTEKFKTLNKWGVIGEELLEWEGRFQNCINGSESWYDVSGKGLLQYKTCPGNPVGNWKTGGYQNLISHLKETLPPSSLALGSPVEHVDWRSASAATSAGPGCRVTLASGTVIEASHVIFTPSLGVLKAMVDQLFSPPLPARKLKAIEGLEIKTVGKIYLEFPKQWWKADSDGFCFLHDIQQSPAEITEENWEDGLLGFYSVYKQPTMLCGWIVGPGATLVGQVPEEEVAQRCVALLRRKVSHKFQVPAAICCKRSAWGSNPWVRGSYSYRSLKTEAMGVTAADLAEPLTDSSGTVPLICFAGEATHDHYYSTVHGALESGRREADRLLSHLNSRVSRGGAQATAAMESVPMREKYSVVVVGAGAAGLGAARELTAQGIKSILILEGNDRIGGRINTILTPSHGLVELGAQWVHGEVGNTVYQFAKSRKLLHHHVSVDGEGNFFMENGREIDGDLVKEVFKVMEGVDKELCGLAENTATSEPTALSVGQVFRRRFFEYLESCVHDSPEIKRLKEALYHWTIRWYRIDNACDSLHQLSANCWGSYVMCPGEYNMNPKRGFLAIMEAVLAEMAPVVKLRSEVECIDYATEVVTTKGPVTRPDGATFPVIVKCRDGREYEAQHVIVTPSIGYLKAHPSLFSPPLPEKLQQAIMSRGFGTLDKIFLEYEEAWWKEDCVGLHMVWTEDIPNFERTVPPKTPSHRAQGNQSQMSECWVKAISGFDPVFHQRAMLCGWIGGPEAEYMETLSEEEVGNACSKLLTKFLARDIPLPKKVYRSQWATDHFFRGSYSYHGLNCNCQSGKKSRNEKLNTPVYAYTEDGDRVAVLALAGEANNTNFYSTVHGAFQSGIAQTTHFLNDQKRFGKCGRLWSKV